MKVLAIISLAAGAAPGAALARLDKEIRASWRLFAAGTLREAYATDDPRTVVFVLESADLAAAKQVLDGLPLVQLGVFRVELNELRPFTNWSRLFASPQESVDATG